MTLKLKKELAQQTRSRGDGGSAEVQPEAQAAQQIEDSAVNLAGGVRERVTDGVAKAVRRGSRNNAEQRQARQRPETPTGETPPPAERTPQPTQPPARDRMRRQAIDDLWTYRTETGQTPPTPRERPAPEIAHEKPGASAPVKQSDMETLPQKERMRQTAIKDRQTQGTELRQKPNAPRERTPAPIREWMPENVRATTAPSSTPQERMKQKAVEDYREKHIEQQREIALPRKAPATTSIQTPQTPMPIPEKGRPATDTQTASPTIRERPKAPTQKEKPPSRAFPSHFSQGNSPMPAIQPAYPAIRERPRRAAAPKEKTAGGAFRHKTRETVPSPARQNPRPAAAPPRSVKTLSAAAKRQAKKAPAAAKAAGRQFIVERGRKQAQREAQRHVLQQSKKAAQAAAEAGKKLVVATVKAVEGMITALAGLLGGGTLVAILCVLGLIAAIIASPFGILFSNAPLPGAVPLNTAVARIRMELNSTLDALQEGEYDGIDITGHPPDWREVVAVFAAKTSTAKDSVDVAALTPDRVNRLRAVFWDMCIVTSEVETVGYPDSNPDDEIDDSYSETYLHITITAKTAEDMRTAYSFTEKQNEALDELLIELPVIDALLEDLAVSEEQARALVRSLPADLAPERRAVVEAACQLVGKVTYFWGGKSLVLGWDDRWGTLQKVWAAGSVTTGTYRAYGLDCSGFVDWAFYNASNGAYYPGHGGGTYTQHSHCAPVTWAEAQPGDLVFTADVGHVGIVGGRDEAGNLLIIHCYDNVGITGAGEFAIVGRPDYFTE